MTGPRLRDVLVRGVLLPAHTLYRNLRPDYRPVRIAAQESLKFRRKAADWPEDRKADWVLFRLRSLLRLAQAESAYYRTVFRQAGFDPRTDFSFEDFAKAPILTKQGLTHAPESLRDGSIPESQVREDSSGGSTGQPVRVWKGPKDRGWAEGGWAWFMERLGITPGARTALLWGHHLDTRPPRRFLPSVQDLLQNHYWFDCFHLDEATLLRYHVELTKLQPEVIVAYGGALASLASVLDQRGLTPIYPTRAVITGAEKVWGHERKCIERVFRKPVHERYGSRDVGLIGFQSDPGHSHRFDVDWANVLVEPDDSIAHAGILVTKLHGDATLLVRYRVGDMAIFPSGAKPGHPSFSLVEVTGRELEGIVLPSGAWIHGAVFPHMLKDYPVADFQVHQQMDYSLTVRIVTRPDWSPTGEAMLRQQLEALSPELTVRIEVVEAIPRTKANKRRPVMSDLAGTTHASSGMA